MQTDRYGLYHLTNAGSCTWHEFAQAIFDLAGVRADFTPIASKEYAVPATRPAFSVLDNVALATLGLPRPRPWQEALAAYLQERKRLGRTC
jgi:dTDP-4-dehydrorhamnose reductase